MSLRLRATDQFAVQYILLPPRSLNQAAYILILCYTSSSLIFCPSLFPPAGNKWIRWWNISPLLYWFSDSMRWALTERVRKGEKRKEGPWKDALCWSRRDWGFSLSEVVVLGQQPDLQTLSLAGTELPSGATDPSWTAQWASQSQVGLSWLG